MSGHIVNDFKDLRNLIAAVTKANPAKTTRQQNEKKMGVHKEEPEAQPIDDKKPKDKKFHAGEEEIKRAYLNLGRAAQGSLEYQRKLLQKELAKMGFKTYSQFAFDAIFKFEQKDFNKLVSIMEVKGLKEGKNLMPEIQKIVDTKGAAKVGGVMLDMFTASVLTQAYAKVNDANKKKMETSNIQILVKLAQKVMGMKEVAEKDKKKKKWNEPLKGFPGNEEIEEGKYLKYSDLLLKKSKLIDKEGPNSPTVKAINKDIEKEMKKLGINEENIQEGTWAVPDSYKKLTNLQKLFLASKKPASEINARKLAVDLYNIYGDDDFYDELEVYMNNPDPKVDLRDIIIKYLKKWVEIKNYKITKAPEKWVSNTTDEDVDIEEIVSEGKPRRGKGNIKRPSGKMIQFKEESRENKLKEQKEQAQESPFKLKSQQYPRAIAINNDGFGKRHATVEDIITACDSFGMILDKELQVEQIQKQLGKGGFISYKENDLEDVFHARETQRVILTLESTIEEQKPIEYSAAEITEAYIMGEEIEFLKPDGIKTAGPVLKKSGNTFNVKDKFTGKSYTYKYINEEKEVKTFNQVIQEVSIGPAGIRKDFPNVWAQKDDRMNNILMALVNLHGYVDNWKSYKKDPKKFVDSLKRIGKNDAGLKKAGLTKREIGESKMGDLLIDIQQGATAKEIAKYHNISIGTAKNFLSDYYGNKPTRTAPGLKKENVQEGKFSKQLIKQAGGIAFDKRYYMGNMTGAVRAIEKLKKGLSDDPKVQDLLRLANESAEPLPTGTTTDYTNWLPEGGDKEAYQKFFTAALKKFGVSSPDELEGDKKKEFFDYVDKNWKGDHEEKGQDVHKSYKMDGRRKNFKEKMRKLGYIKSN